MPKWVDEKVLQRYWKDRCRIYDVDGKKIKSARFNKPFDRYPDVFNEFEDGNEVPAEVEWKTSDFNHDIDVLRENNGFLIVYHKDQNFSLPQVIIEHEDFKKWFRKKSTIILTESLREYSKEKAKREFPKIWLRYNDIKNNENMEISLKIGYDGFPEKTKTLPRVKDVKKNDLVLFVGPYKSSKPGKGGRVAFADFKGYMRRVILI